MPVLDAILAATRATLPGLRQQTAQLERAAAAMPTPPDFSAALRRPTVALISEVKRRSPSAGSINAGLDPVVLATDYQQGGAAAISVLTDKEFFGGSLEDLVLVTRGVSVPVLRKDFILDETQLLEARAAGAAAVLLIVRALDPATLRRLLHAATGLGLGTLVEIHTAGELDRALEAGATTIGVNARDLDDFSIDRAGAWKLLASIPPTIVAVAESGMATVEQVNEAAAAGADAVLIGGALAASANPGALAAQFSGVSRRAR